MLDRLERLGHVRRTPLLDSYDEEQLTLIADFLGRAAQVTSQARREIAHHDRQQT